MSDLMEEKEIDGPIAGDGAEESKGKKRSQLNGNGPTSAPKEVADAPVKTKEDREAPKTSMTRAEKQDAKNAKAGEPTTDAKDGLDSSLPSDSKGMLVSSESGAVQEESPNLGSILKGSAFEIEEAKKEAPSQKQAAIGTSKATGKTAGGPKPPAAPAITRSTQPSIAMEQNANGKPKEPQATETKPQPKAPSEQPHATKIQTATNSAPTAAAAKPTSKEAEKKGNPAKAAPAAINTSSDKDKITKSGAAARTPTGSSTAVASKKDNSPEKIQSKASKEPTKEPATTPKPSTAQTNHKATGPSDASKPSTTKSTSSAASTTTKPPSRNTAGQKSPPTSGIGFTKPKPRSPTRPVKLPAHLTAQTAASAAKHGNESHVEPHKDTPTSSSRTPHPRLPANPPPQQRKLPCLQQRRNQWRKRKLSHG